MFLSRVRHYFMEWMSSRYRQAGRMAARNRFSDTSNLLHNEAKLIVDGGASVGNTVARFQKLFPEAVIHAFEPNPSALIKLNQRFELSTNVVIHPEALGASNETIQLQILERESASSILNPTVANARYHPMEMTVKNVVKAPQVRLDSVLDSDIDVLKLDLQGYELEALRGAESVLSRTKIILTEIEFIPMYENQPLFSDIDHFLGNYQFRLFNLYELWTHPDGQLTAGDALYVNPKYID